jgi:HNH endonuclease
MIDWNRLEAFVAQKKAKKIRVITEKDYVVDENGCWIWKHTKTSDGYAYYSIRGVWHNASAVMWAQVNGPMPADTEPHHKCFVPPCINPAHIEPKTHAENLKLRRPYKRRV